VGGHGGEGPSAWPLQYLLPAGHSLSIDICDLCPLSLFLPYACLRRITAALFMWRRRTPRRDSTPACWRAIWTQQTLLRTRGRPNHRYVVLGLTGTATFLRCYFAATVLALMTLNTTATTKRELWRAKAQPRVLNTRVGTRILLLLRYRRHQSTWPASLCVGDAANAGRAGSALTNSGAAPAPL